MKSFYNEVNWLKSLDEIEGATTRTSAYTFDPNGNILTLTLPNAAVTTKAFDELNRVTQITNAAATYDQTYDLAGNVLEIVESYPSNPQLDRTVANDYDKIYRLKQELDTPAAAGSSPKQTDFTSPPDCEAMMSRS
ncbi:MAG: RHS repeat domain-containing protein [Verrucomicrobiota bacterium]